MKIRTVSAVVAALFSFVALADQSAPNTDIQKYSYAIGHQIGQRMKAGFDQQKITVDAGSLAHAIEDVLSEAKPALTDAEMKAALDAERQKQAAKLSATADENKKEGDAFRAKYRKQKGVKTTDSGLAYKILTAGKGKQPGADSTVVVNYKGALIDGTEFDSSYKRNTPATFGLKGIVKGWQEVLPMMKEGSKWEVVIPPELAYGEHGAGGVIGPDATLVFEIELLKVK